MRALAPVALLLLAPAASAQLDLSSAGSIDITALGFDFPGGATFGDRGSSLWLTEAAFVNDIVEIDPVTGQVITSFDASVIPGVTAGPDAIAINPTNGNLSVFSAFRGGVGEGVVDPVGNLVASYGQSRGISAAAFDDQARLWGYSDASRVLIEIEPVTGATIQQITLAYTGRVSAMDFDPVTGNLFLLDDPGSILREIALPSGAELSQTPIASLLISNVYPGGFAFDSTGDFLYVCKGSGAGAQAVVVLARGGDVGSNYCSPAVPNSTGLAGTITASGSLVAGGNPLTLRAQFLPLNEFGYFLCSQGVGFVPMAGGSQGALCLSLPIGRFSQQIVNSGQTGVMNISVDTLALPLTPPVAAQSGETWFFQCWYRDQNPGATSNFTDGISLTFL